MDLLQELRKKSLRRALPGSVLLVIVALAVFLIFDGPALLRTQGLQPDVSATSPDTLSGQYAGVELHLIYDSYLYTGSSNVEADATSKSYIIETAGGYMGLELPQRYLDQADALLEASSSYFGGGAAPTDSFVVFGTVLPMDSTDLSYYHETVGYDEGSAEFQAMFSPYYLKVGYLSANTAVSTAAFTSTLAGCLLLYAVLRVVWAAFGWNQKKFLRVVDEIGDREAVLEQLTLLFEGDGLLPCLRLNEDFFFYWQGNRPMLLACNQILWAYQQTTQHRTNWVPTGKSYALIVALADGSRHAIPMKAAQVPAALEGLEQILAGIVLGYDDALDRSFRADRSAFPRSQTGCAAARPTPQPTVEASAD